MENRRNPRFRARFDALYTDERDQGTGILADISRSGAYLERASLRPPIGSKVRLYIFVRPVAPFEVVGEVVRHGENGFAIENLESTAEIAELIDDVAAIFSFDQELA